jgi:thiamine biosynthesis lipoprotein
MNRRDFLNSRHVARTAGQVLAPLVDIGSTRPAHPNAISFLRFSRRAMATNFEIFFPYSQSGAAELATEALDLIDALEAQLSVYRSDSEVSRLNERAAQEAVVVEERLFALFQLARRISTETGNAFDVTAGPLIKAWGFYCRRGRVPGPATRQAALQCVGMRHVELIPERLSVRYLRPGVEINLGSIGKGYALDQAAEVLRGRGAPSALLHGGASSVLGLGSQPGDRRGWPIKIQHPWRGDTSLGTIYVRDRALGTSAATFQHFEYNKRKLGHLLDPRSGWPAEGMASVTVLAATAAEADALATAFYVLGVDKARAYCVAHPDAGAVLLPAGEQSRPVILGLTPDEFVHAVP